MPDYADAMANPPKLSEKKQVEMTKSDPQPMPDTHNDFIQKILKLVEQGVIDPLKPETLVNDDAYNKLNDEWQAKVDLASVNMAHQLQLIIDFYKSRHTPNESAELQNLIDYLWEMKQRIKEHEEVFTF